jgi:hypothetical protein
MRQGLTKAEADIEMRKENGVLIRQNKAKLNSMYQDVPTTKTSKEQFLDLLAEANSKSKKTLNSKTAFDYNKFWDKQR